MDGFYVWRNMDGTSGAPAGKISESGSSDLTNDFATISDQSIEAIASRIIPRQVTSGVNRGTQRIVSDDGSYVTLGNIPATTEFGFAFYDTNGNLTSKVEGADTVYNDNNGTPNILLGLRNKERGLFIAETGVDVTTADDSQLLFNSNKSFTVALQSSYAFPSFGSIPDSGSADSGTIAIPHNIGFIPSVNCFAPTTLGGYAFTTAPAGFPLGDITLAPSGWVIQQGDGEFFNFYYAVDATNLYLGLTFFNSSGAPVSTLPVTIYYTVFTLNPTIPIS